MTIRNLLQLTLILTLTVGCVRKNPENHNEIKETSKPISEFLVLKDSLNYSWNSMIESDDKKLLLVKRLIEEISYTPQPDPIKIEKLKQYQAKVKSNRYTLNNLTEPDNIDKYDRSTDTLLRSVYQLAAATPNVERYPLVNELIGDINALDNQVVVYRANYDRWAKKYNAYLDAKIDEVKAKYHDSTGIKPLGLFELQE